MTTLALVDSPAAVAAARRDHPDATLTTDNPLLAHATGAADTVENIDCLVPQELALGIGRQALALTARIEEELSRDEITSHFGLPKGKLGIMGPTSRLVASLLYRGTILARALAAYEPDIVALRLADMPRWEPTQPLMLPRFASPARPLAELGFFGGVTLDIATVPTVLPKSINDTMVKGARRLALLPASVLVNEVAAILRLPARRRGTVVVGRENEALRETLPWLRLAGVESQRAGSLIVRPSPLVVGFGEKADPDAKVAAALEAPLKDAIAGCGQFSDVQARALVDLIVLHVSWGLRHLASRLPAQKQRVDELFPGEGGVLLTNGLFGPAGMMVHRLCEAKHVTVYEFEHGVTAGLAALTDTKLEYGGPPPVKVLFACSPRASEVFNGGGAGPARAIGLPDQVRRTLRRPLQRRLARRALGLGGESVVMHVSTLAYFGNHRPGFGAPTETTTFSLDRKFIEHVYPAVPHRVVFKQYPTQRFPFEPNYEDIFRIAPNLTLRKDEDFRYIRSAADVIVTMTPTSTLGWCIGADVPLIWLDSRVANPLSSDIMRAAFKESFLFVDLDAQDWSERLLDILKRPLAVIQDEWERRRAPRERLYRMAISGPPGTTGRRAASVIVGDLLQMARDTDAAQYVVQPREGGSLGTKS